MPRFAVVEHHSGNLWGIASAETIVAACKKCDLQANSLARSHFTYEAGEWWPSTGYHVYAVPKGLKTAHFDASYGDLCAREFPHAGFVRVRSVM